MNPFRKSTSRFVSALCKKSNHTSTSTTTSPSWPNERNDKTNAALPEEGDPCCTLRQQQQPPDDDVASDVAPTVMMASAHTTTDYSVPSEIRCLYDSDMNCSNSHDGQCDDSDDCTLGDEEFEHEYLTNKNGSFAINDDEEDDDDSMMSDWTEEDKLLTIKHVEESIKRLDRVLFEVKKQLYHRNLFLQLRYRSDCPAAAIKIMKEILQLEGQRDRNVYAILSLQSLLGDICKSDTLDSDSEDDGADVNYVLANRVRIPNYPRLAKAILARPAPAHGFQSCEEILDEAKTRIGAVSMLSEPGSSTLSEL